MAELEGNGGDAKSWRWQQRWQSLKETAAMADLEGNGKAWRWRRWWQILKAMAVMAKSEGDILLAWVCCRGLWLLIARVCRRGLNQCLRLGSKWVVGLNRLWFLGWFQSFSGVWCWSMVGINVNGCGLLLVVVGDGYLVVVCSVGWDFNLVLQWWVWGFGLLFY